MYTIASSICQFRDVGITAKIKLNYNSIGIHILEKIRPKATIRISVLAIWHALY